MRRVTLTLALLLIAGCAQQDHLEEHQETVPAGGFLELDFDLDRGDVLEWSWSTDGAPLEFDVHTHFDGRLERPVAHHAAAHEGTYTAERDGAHSLMWGNPGDQDVALHLRVTAGGQAHSGRL